MKHKEGFLLLLALLLAASSAVAQTEGRQLGSANGHSHFSQGKMVHQSPDENAKASGAPQTEDRKSGEEPPVDGIAAARRQYTQLEAASPEMNDFTLAQLPRRMPRGPMRTRPAMGYPPPRYRPWSGQASGRHALIGAIVGFGIGALVGSRGSSKDALVLGAFSSAIGAAWGAAMPPMPARRYPPWPDDGDEEASRHQGTRSLSVRASTTPEPDRANGDSLSPRTAP